MPPLGMRLVGTAILVAARARLGPCSTVVVGETIALPLPAFSYVTILVGMVPLLATDVGVWIAGRRSRPNSADGVPASEPVRVVGG